MTELRRVLVLSAAVGAGHLRAAEAVTAALQSRWPELHVENHDVLTFTNGMFRRVYGQFYLDLVNRAPHLLGYFYDLMDQPSRSGKNRGDRVRLAIERLNLRRFQEFLTATPWDLVINTHFLPAELIARMTTEGSLSTPQVTVCTDFDTHRLWVNQPCRRYFCATEEGAEYLVHWGVPRSDVQVTGIPIHPVFAQPIDRDRCLAKHGLAGDRPIVLQSCGGFGVGPVEQTYRALLSIERPLEIVAICGKNEALRQALAAIEVPARHRAHPIGFTQAMDEWMGVADLAVTKPGGLTTSECLARGLPLAVANPIPGQESRNSDYLLERGAAIKINHPALTRLKIEKLLADPARLAAMRAAAQRLGRPQAAFDVATAALAVV